MNNKISQDQTRHQAFGVSEEIYTIILQAFECTLGLRSATYISGPITTGLRFVDWYISVGHTLENDNDNYRISKVENVQHKNENEIREAACKVRHNGIKTVIEPASLYIPSWTQEDYYRLWTETMKRYVTRVIALDGWQYSIGCVVEFYHATECDILIESFSGEILNAENARILIHDAADDIESRGASFKLLQRMAQTLRSYNLINGAIGV